MKKISFIVNDLSYGGCANEVITLANSLITLYDIEIISLYKYLNTPLEINKKIKVSYLIESNLSLKLKKYQEFLRDGKIKKLLESLWNDYFKKGKIFSFITDAGKSMAIVSLKRVRIKNAIKKLNTNIVITNSLYISNKVNKYGMPHIKKISWEHRCPHGNDYLMKKMMKSLSNFDMVIVGNQDLKNEYQQLFLKKKLEVILIPNALKEIPLDQASLKSKKIITVGKLHKEKGYDDLLEVMKIIQDRGYNYQLEIVGDGYEMENIIKQITDLKLKNILISGLTKHEEVINKIKTSSLFVMTSHTESFGIGLLEAMSCGVPIIAFDEAEAARELIKNDINGYLIKNRDCQKMAMKIIALMDDYELRYNLGTCGKEISNSFDINAIKGEWIKIL